MGKLSTTQSVTQLIEPVLREENLELMEVEFKRLGKKWFLRVFIDKESGITLEDCQRTSRLIEDMIEVEDIIGASYVLEVSSPGLDRPLKTERDFLKFKNKEIKVYTFSPVENKKHFSGIIRDFRNKVLYLEIAGKVLEIPKERISKAQLVIKI